MAAENATVIGKSVQIRGEVNGSEDLLVDGQVEGTVTLSESRLTIGPHANVTANVSARDVVLLGRLNGNVRATGRVELRKGCDLVGDIVAGRLSIEENALFRGKVDLVQPTDKPTDKNAAAMAAGVPPTAKPAAAEPSLFKAPVQK